MTRIADVFQVREAGRLTVIAMNPEGGSDYSRVEQCRNELVSILDQAHCRVVRFDVAGIPFLASGILGLLVSLRKMGVEVQLQNASEHIRDVLHVTKLDSLVELYAPPNVTT
jgi:anti-sigma B factor antagonist